MFFVFFALNPIVPTVDFCLFQTATETLIHMQYFKIRPDSFGDIKKKAFLKLIPGLCGIVVFATVMNMTGGNAYKSDIAATIVPIIVGMTIVALGVFRSVNRYLNLLKSYTLIVDGDLIIREQQNTQTISLNINDIKEIIKNNNRSFLIKGNKSVNFIIVPGQIENYNELEQLLNQIKPVSEKTKLPLLQKYSIIFSLLGLGLMIVLYTVENKVIIATCGTILVAVLIWNLINTQRSKNIDSPTKRRSWFYLIVIASIIFFVVTKLTD